MNVLYPAKSAERLSAICEKLATLFTLPPFRIIHSSEYFESAQSSRGPFQLTVTQYFGSINSEQTAQIGAPDHWNLAWRAAVGLHFNYQVAIARGAVTRYQQRSISRKLRGVFTEIRLHGDPVAA
jgi:hypothetical protein